MKTALVIAAIFANCTASATDFMPSSVGLHIGSKHLDAAPSGREPWNNVNPGVYARWDNGLVVGTLYNSERRQSVYAAYMLESAKWHGLSVAVMGGLITGYEKPIKPVASVSAALSVTDKTAVRLSYMPKTSPRKSAVVHLSAEWSF